jgi:hypothetical protein
MSVVKLPRLAWYEPGDLSLALPDSWQVEVCNVAGYSLPVLKPEEIEAAIGEGEPASNAGSKKWRLSIRR